MLHSGVNNCTNGSRLQIIKRLNDQPYCCLLSISRPIIALAMVMKSLSKDTTHLSLYVNKSGKQANLQKQCTKDEGFLVFLQKPCGNRSIVII